MTIEKYFKDNIKNVKIYVPGKSRLETSNKVLKLSSNENLYGPCEEVYKFLKEFKGINFYPEENPRELLNLLSKYLGLCEENILLTNGSDEGLDIIYKGFTYPNDKILIFYPTFSMYEILGEIYSTRIFKVRLIERDDSFEFPENSIKIIKEKRPKIVFICSPNNPTGNIIEEGLLTEILNLDTIVVLDEAYAEFSKKSYVKLVREYDNLICLRTFSKAFGLAGIRLGYIVANETVIDYLRRIRLPFNVNVLAQKLGEIVLKNLDYYKRIVEMIIRDREYLYNELKKFNGLKVFKSYGNFVLFKSSNGSYIYNKLLENGIIVRTCEGFGLSNDYIRVTVGKREDVEEFLNCMKSIFAS